MLFDVMADSACDLTPEQAKALGVHLIPFYVSPNGKDYYKYHASKLLILPGTVSQRPSAEYLDWHNQNVYLG